MILINKLITKCGKNIELKDLVDEFYLKLSRTQSNRAKRFFLQRVKLNLASIIDSKKKQEFIRVIKRDHSILLKSDPTVLKSKIDDYERLGYNTLLFDDSANKGRGKQTIFGGLIEDLFGYGTFRDGPHAIWLAEQLNIKTCPYCNAQYTLTYSKNVDPTFFKTLFKSNEREKERALFEFDHFFPKSRYPYLSTSIYNLVPACKPCNNLKGSAKTDLLNYVHPYQRDFNKMFEFDCSDKDVIDFLLSKKKIEDVEVILKSRKSGTFKVTLKNHIELFDLDKIYQLHKDVVEELYLKSYYYNSTRQKELLEIKITGTNKNLFTKEVLARFILGNYALDEDINKRPLSKMTKDIAEKIHILDFMKK